MKLDLADDPAMARFFSGLVNCSYLEMAAGQLVTKYLPYVYIALE